MKIIKQDYKRVKIGLIWGLVLGLLAFLDYFNTSEILAMMLDTEEIPTEER